MEKYITDARTGLKYELIGDYYFVAGDDGSAPPPIGIWGKRHLQYLKQHRRGIYLDLQMNGICPVILLIWTGRQKRCIPSW